jgi:predicted RNase H-like HicB family nuclease
MYVILVGEEKEVLTDREGELEIFEDLDEVFDFYKRHRDEIKTEKVKLEYQKI